ncbi:MAG: HAMP domain-containing protein [Candidatus Eremiobacteraeota bacterium]|nr:HAMP domain-containing protein [Candidatus Eremiobacteraeota bacterium]
MMGLRLRYQIAGFLFVLFTVVVLTMGYFNVSILNDQVRRLSLYRSKTTAKNTFKILDRFVPADVTSIEEFLKRKKAFNEFLKYISSIESLRNFQIYDSHNNLIYSRLPYKDVLIDNKPALKEVVKTNEPVIKVWAVDLYDGRGEEIESYGVLETRMLVGDYYIPIDRKGELIGIARISVKLEKTSALTKVFFIGNLSLSIVFILTAFIAIYVWSKNAIDRPLKYLLQAQDQLSRGDFDAHVELELPANNELGIIANSFNRMAQELKVYKEELEQKSKKLELLNEQYRKLNDSLEQEVDNKTREQREFFSLVTHDLKIPLAAIKGYTSLLKKVKTGRLNNKQEQFVHSIETSCTHLLNMVRNMLDSVKYDEGKVYYYQEKFDLKELISEVQGQLHPIISEKSINLIISIPEYCNMVFADRTKIGQVFSNIISNAIDHLPDGGKVEIKARDTRDMIEICISDNGSGIPPEQLPLIFNKFKQIPGKESPSTSLGLGLYIVKKIMEGHEMKTWAKSTEGEGSEFYFTLKEAVMNDDGSLRTEAEGEDIE